MLKKILVHLAGILSLLLGLALCVISAVTLVKIIASGDSVMDMDLAIVMVLLFLLALGLIALANRLIYGRFSEQKALLHRRKERLLAQLENLKAKTNVKIFLLFIAAICLGMIYVFSGTIPEIFFLFTGTFCMMAFGALQAIAADKKGKLSAGHRWGHQFRAIIGLCTFPYMFIAFFLMGL